ncbi:MAG: FAD-binding protein [Alphaproteobacteria bacterium]|nr:MAG: FAD-binding protein [Alphaproteobacteria bacterium]
MLEEALENRAVGLGVFVPPGDSMLMVNKYGQRVVNEKRNYNDRTRVHLVYDPSEAAFPNQFLFMIYDQRCADIFAGNFPFPHDAGAGRFIIQAATLADLAAKIDARLASLAPKISSVRLAPAFADALDASVARFNAFARAGKDADFHRGASAYDREWDQVFGKRRQTSWGENDLPNSTLYPLADKGPYYAIILAAGALDTNGGPLINERAQVLDADGRPIAGLYGAGNCIACPSRSAYFGAGGTIGLALTFGYIAGKNGAAEPVREL